MTEFEIELRDKLVAHLNLEDLDLDDFTRETSLFGEGGLELDSIDAIEIEVMVQKEYGVDILPSERSRSTFGSLGTLADFIQRRMAEKG